jgi:hypothetical protein
MRRRLRARVPRGEQQVEGRYSLDARFPSDHTVAKDLFFGTHGASHHCATCTGGGCKVTSLWSWPARMRSLDPQGGTRRLRLTCTAAKTHAHFQVAMCQETLNIGAACTQVVCSPPQRRLFASQRPILRRFVSRWQLWGCNGGLMRVSTAQPGDRQVPCSSPPGHGPGIFRNCMRTSHAAFS